MIINLWLLPGIIFLVALVKFLRLDSYKLINRLTIFAVILVSILTTLTALLISNSYVESINILNFDKLTLSLRFIFDHLTIAMILLVSIISLLIHKYAARYLLSDVAQGQFMAQLSLLTASIMILVMSGNLLTAFLGWQLIGLSLYLLLNHYRHGIKANKAAKKKFIVNRFGDVCFLIAILVAYQYYGSTDFNVLFQPALTSEHFLGIFTYQSMILLLIFVAIMTKSAQFPFYFWLPDTMEAPTPVSAIMHAGAINAGGFLLARLSPLIAQAPSVMTIIFVIGLISALMGGFFMLTRSDIKKQLAYSTMGQMGYMIMQCGLGCFAAAIFHLIAHGIFKATLFLNSGSALMPGFIGQRNGYNTSKRFVTRFIFTIIFTSISISTGILWLNLIHGGNDLNIVLWLFLSITLLQITWSMFRDKRSVGHNIFLLLLLNTIFILYLGFIHLFQYGFKLGIDEKSAILSFWQLTFVGALVAAVIVFWFIPPRLLLKLNIAKRLYLFGLNNGYLEIIIRRLFLNPLRMLGDIGNGALLLGKGNITRLLSSLFLIALTAAIILYGIRNIYQHKHISIENTTLVVFSMIILIIFLVIANRAKTLRYLIVYLLVIVVALSCISCFAGNIPGKIMALFYLINMGTLFASLWPLLSQYYKKNHHLSIQQDRLPHRAFYLGIILMLFMGLPGSAGFISEFFILHWLMLQHMYWSMLIVFPMILIAVIILHTLQIYVFNPSNVSRVDLYLSPQLHVLCWSSIGFNIFNGIHPSWLLHTLSQAYGVIL